MSHGASTGAAPTAEELKKRQRVLDNDRLKYQQAAQAQMAKQQDTITALKKENEKLKQDVAAQSGGTYDFAAQDRLAAMQAEVDELERKVQFERLRKNDLAKRQSMVRMDMMRSRKSMGGVNVTTENTAMVDKQVRILENRLDQALVKFNEALSYNKDLRQQIDSLREERKVFQRIYKRLENELHEKKKAMAEKIERANQDYEERDSLQQQLEGLRAQAKDQQKVFEEQFASIEALLQQYKHAREQQQQQAAQAQAAAAAAKAAKGDAAAFEMARSGQLAGGGGADKGGTGRNAAGDSPVGAKRGNNLNATFDGGRSATADDASAVEEETDLQEVVDQLKEATGIQDLDVLHSRFVKAEEHNFSLYNFINELNNEQEVLEGEIAALREQLAGEKGDAQRRKLLKELENELARTEQQEERLAAETQRHKEALSVVRGVTQELVARLGCSEEAMREVCGSTEVTDLNMLAFLGLIEARTNEVLFAFQGAAARDQRKRAAARDEEARQRRERRIAERQARIDAGRGGEDDDDADAGDDGADDAGSGDPHERSLGDGDDGAAVRVIRFVGSGPTTARNAGGAQLLVRQTALPHTNAGDAGADGAGGGAGGGGGAADDVEEGNVLSHEVLRQQMEARLQARREKEERGGRGKKKERKAGGQAGGR